MSESTAFAAPQPAVSQSTAPQPVIELESWSAYHLFYHGDRDLLIQRLLTPLLRELVRDGIVERFFFVRYDLGGPHVRLRWRTASAAHTEPAERALDQSCGRFFDLHPADTELDEGAIREINRMLIGNDPGSHRQDDQVFPNHFWAPFPPRFETERYGGPLRFPQALDGFCCSSLSVLLSIEQGADLPPSRRRVQWLRTLAALAWGLAADEHEFHTLLGYDTRFMGEDFQSCRQPGDRLFESRKETFTALFQSEMSRSLGLIDGSEPAGLLFQAGQSVATALADTSLGPIEDRWYSLASHLHMTANRLGLSNPEEVYLSQILSRAGRHLQTREPRLWARLWQQKQQLQTSTPAPFLDQALLSWAEQGEDRV